MADYSVSITVAAADDTAQLAAMRWHYGQVIDSVTKLFRDMTPSEVKARMKSDIIDDLINMHKHHARFLAVQIEYNVPDPVIT